LSQASTYNSVFTKTQLKGVIVESNSFIRICLCQFCYYEWFFAWRS